jgi:cyclophilin family peptidyl-prolyl cis-trans isomerase
LDPKQKLTTRLRSKPQSVVGVTGKEDVGMKVGGLKKKEEGPTDDGDVERLFEPAKTLKKSTYIRFELENLNPDGSSFTSGEFVLELKPEWAPLGVARFHELTAQQFWDECRFFRVFEKFVAQFGINGSPEINDKWKDQAILDDPVGHGNERGTLTMATSGKNTRSTQLFINKQNNKYLDKQGFAPIGQIIRYVRFTFHYDCLILLFQPTFRSCLTHDVLNICQLLWTFLLFGMIIIICRGMDVVDRIYFGYSGDGPKAPNQGKINRQGNEYLKEHFPKLSYISKATYIDESEIMDQKESQ